MTKKTRSEDRIFCLFFRMERSYQRPQARLM